MQLSEETIFCIGASDGCLANLGSFAMDKTIAAMTIGTSAAVRIASKTPIHDFSGMIFSYLLDEETFICGAPVNNGGNIIRWLKNTFPRKMKDDKDFEEIFNCLTEVPAGTEGLIFLPYLYGERAPVWDEQSSGAYIGIRPHHTRQHFTRAALEGVCFSLKQVTALMEKTSGAIKEIHVSGGLVHSDIWLQLLADITGKKIILVAKDDASSLGAAYLGMKAIGWTKQYIDLPGEGIKHFMPDASRRTVYEKNYQVFIQLYPALKDPMHLLYSFNQ